MKNFSILLLFTVLVVFAMSCNEDDPIIKTYENGAIVANESSLSFFNFNGGIIEQNIFETVNSTQLNGNIISVTAYGDKIFIVLDSGQIEVVEAATLISVGTIDGLENPQEVLGIDSDKFYVSQGNDTGTGSIAVFNLSDLLPQKNIIVGNEPTKLLKKGSFVYVVNSGGNSTDSMISLINTVTDEVETTVIVGENPNSLDLFGANFLVLCSGRKDAVNPSNNTAGSAWRVAGLSPDQLLTFDDVDATPTNLIETSDSRYLCLYKGNIHEIIINGLNFSLSNPIISGDFSSFYVDLSFNNRIYAFANNRVYRYEIDGTLIDDFETGGTPVDILVRN